MLGAKRKARKIQVSEENEEPTAPPATAPDEPMNDGESHIQSLPDSSQRLLISPDRKRQLADAHPSTPPAPPTNTSPSTIKFTRRPIRSSSLRKSTNITDDPISAADEDDDARPAVVRPNIGRSGSTKIKKKASSSRLSFGGTAAAAAAEEDATPPDSQPFTTPRKNPAAATLTQRAAENSALRASAGRALPTRSFGAERERPSYSREYLEELQSSTPNTPQGLEVHDGAEGEAVSLDAAELEGAVFVPAADLSVSAGGAGSSTILSTAEIREKKERRARLAKEGGAYGSDDDDEDGYISLQPKKKKDETRLIAEDEDLGEGYDEFVEDGRLELGRRGEKEARTRHRREMAELIDAAEGGASEDEGSDSDAERKAAYEAAQTRAAMDGLHRLAAEEDVGGGGGGRLVIPRMRALPELDESLARMRALVRDMEEQVAAKRKRIEGVEREKKEILDREKEVQEVLNQAGMKYQAAMGVKSEHVVDPGTLAAQSPLRPGAPAAQIPSGERGLESFGTPTRRAEDVEDAMEE